MARTKGAKNIEKTNDELIADLKSRGYVIEDGMLVPPKGSPAEPVEIKPIPFEPEKELSVPDDIETYKCGGCKHILTAPFPVCPECGERLEWE